MKKLPEQSKLKQAKLLRSRRRRERLALKRKTAERRERSRRNDLLPELVIDYVPIDEIRPPRRRTRKNDPNQIARIAASIVEFSFNQPVLVRRTRVIDGWLRVLAARELGLDRVPVIDCSHLDEPEARALALAINRTSERGEWDLDALRLEFLDLMEFEIDLDATGFSVEEQDIILFDDLSYDEAVGEEGGVENPPAVPATEAGYIWLLGDHRVICGSALEKETYEALLGEEQVHAVLTDPPYNVKIKNNVSGLGKKVHGEFVMASGEMTDREFETFLTSVLTQITAWLVAGAVLFAFMDWRSIHLLYAAGDKTGLNRLNLAVWYKQSGGMGALYRSAHELIAVFCKGEKPRVNNVELGRHGRDRTNVWEAPGANRRGSSASEMLEHHATPKPIELCEDAILDVTRRGDIVLDVFLGSGTTLMAAESTGRKCRGIELEPGFVDVTIRRWEKHTGKQAILASTGETYANVAERRAKEATAAELTNTSADGEQ